ncbi:MAG: AAA family ATPase [Desulfuromonadaceae bacterium]
MSKKSITITERIQSIRSQLCAGLHEREEVMTVALLAVLAGQSVFLLGPPGTAKSLMARRLSCAFKDKEYFEYLMQKFSTPEEIFGPIDIVKLKVGSYYRKTENYLPKADFAFLDEIWKSNSAILNTLLTIINEKKFRNGDDDPNVPLKALIGASNETPKADEGLEALWDRFIVRLYVPRLSEDSSFEALLQNSSVKEQVMVADELAISKADWEKWQDEIETVKLSPETMQAIHFIKNELKLLHEKDPQSMEYYVSDRRWQRAVKVIKSSAFFSGRDKTTHLDTLLLRHCLWSSKAGMDVIGEIVIRHVGSLLIPDINLAEIDQLLEQAESFV